MTLPSAGHLPATDAQGRFLGETGEGSQTSLVVLDDGTAVETLFMSHVDHDARRVFGLDVDQTDAPPLDPPAVRMEHTAERRATRYPTRPGLDGSRYTRWGYAPGGETNVQARNAGDNLRVYTRQYIRFDGVSGAEDVATLTQSGTAYDFDWLFRLQAPFPAAKGDYQDLPRDVTPTPTPDGHAYRVQVLDMVGVTGSRTQETLVQGHLAGLWLAGDLDVGQGQQLSEHAQEVTRILEKEYPRNEAGEIVGPAVRTQADVWWTLANLTEVLDSGSAPDPANPPGTPEYLGGNVYRYVNRAVTTSGLKLRDILRPPWAESPELPDPGFRALEGEVKFVGDTLSAFGHEFTDGTWAALRDRPRWDAEKKAWDYSPLIVLHASDTTVTAVRPDGSIETCTRAQFVTDVLRLPLPDDPEAELPFQGFGEVGKFSHSWPPEWAWVVCTEDTRALCAHDPWRDSYKKEAPEDSPLDWTWKARPGKRPKTMPATAPRGLLGLTLADVAGEVRHDELLPKGQGPIEPPVQATSGGVDVLKKVGKRLPYSPAHIPDERDDRTGVSGPVAVTFGPLPPVPDVKGELEVHYFTALYLIGKFSPDENGDVIIRINGVPEKLAKLGHNRAERGFHPYAVEVPPTDTYALDAGGRISLIGRCARVYFTGEAQSG